MTRVGKQMIAISGVWLRREGNYAVVCVEMNGKWVEACRELLNDAPFSHIAEPAGIIHRAEAQDEYFV